MRPSRARVLCRYEPELCTVMLAERKLTQPGSTPALLRDRVEAVDAVKAARCYGEPSLPRDDSRREVHQRVLESDCSVEPP